MADKVVTKDDIREKTKPIEANIIGCFWHNPELFLYYTDFTKDDFKNDIWKFYFLLGKKMASKDVKKIDEVAVEIFLDGKDKLLEVYNNYGGYEIIDSLEMYATEENVEAYIKELKKWGTVYDLLDKFTFTENKISKLQDLNVDEVYSLYTAQLNNVFINVNDDVETSKLDEDLDEIIEDAHKGLEIGMPLKSPILSEEIGGWINGQVYIMGGLSGSGKAQPLESKVLTKDGYKKMGDIKVGDWVFGEDGKLHEVIGVYPQGVKSVYEVVFSDGSKTQCCDEHLWNIQNPYQRTKNEYSTLSLKEIMKNPLYKIGKSGYKKWQVYIPMTKPVEFEKKQVPMDAYLLGVLIGDGGISETKVTFTNIESDIVERVEKGLNKINATLSPTSLGKCYKENEYFVRSVGDINYIRNDYYKTLYMQILDRLGLINKHSYEKFIPKEYLFNDIDTRLDVLKGLIDTDGEVNGSGYIFNTTSKQLALDVQFLVHSLGGTAKISNRQTYYTYKNKKRKGRKSYRLNIKMPRNISIVNSKKHKKKFKQGQTESRRTMREINYIGEKECQCIMLDSPSHLYLTDDMIVTHNTTVTQEVVLSSVWELNEPCVIMLNEQDHVKWKQQFLTFLINNVVLKDTKYRFNAKRWRQGKFSDIEFEWIKKATDMIKSKEVSGQIIFVQFKAYSQKKAERIIRKYASLGIKKFVLDTFKLSSERDDNEAFWLSMQEDMRKFDDLVKKSNLNVGLWCTLQLQKGSRLLRYLTGDNIGMAKNVVDVASVTILMRRLWNDEYGGKAHEIEVKKPIPGTDSYTIVNLNPNKQYIVLFIEKNRNGSSQTYQIVAEQDLGTLAYKEVGICDIPFGS